VAATSRPCASTDRLFAPSRQTLEPNPTGMDRELAGAADDRADRVQRSRCLGRSPSCSLDQQDQTAQGEQSQSQRDGETAAEDADSTPRSPLSHHAGGQLSGRHRLVCCSYRSTLSSIGRRPATKAPHEAGALPQSPAGRGGRVAGPQPWTGSKTTSPHESRPLTSEITSPTNATGPPTSATSAPTTPTNVVGWTEQGKDTDRRSRHKAARSCELACQQVEHDLCRRAIGGGEAAAGCLI